MAGDWLPVEFVTPDKPEIKTIAKQCHCSRGDAFLGWFRVYCHLQRLCDEHGRAEMVSPEELDQVASLPGLGEVLQQVNWVLFDDNGASVMGWKRFNSKSARVRIQTAERMKRMRTGDA
jgi:hypothetical protein